MLSHTKKKIKLVIDIVNEVMEKGKHVAPLFKDMAIGMDRTIRSFIVDEFGLLGDNEGMLYVSKKDM